jgi:hypothetical protein
MCEEILQLYTVAVSIVQRAEILLSTTGLISIIDYRRLELSLTQHITNSYSFLSDPKINNSCSARYEKNVGAKFQCSRSVKF